MNILDLVVFILASHGLVHLARVAEITDGVRQRLGVSVESQSFLSRLLRCPFCTGIWAGPPVAALIAISAEVDMSMWSAISAIPVASLVCGVTSYAMDMALLVLEETLSRMESRRESLSRDGKLDA